uniref:Uncharacterized protein n=1 Tax=Pseudobryopsis hainanensis TaxID=2320808 RepID=A0A3S7SZN1_9CHLO|nr:hypothetical protein [Pseudobryopsis hainanensis]
MDGSFLTTNVLLDSRHINLLYSQTVDFSTASGDPSSFMRLSIRQEFPTDVIRGEAALKGYDLIYGNKKHHEIYTCGAKLTNVRAEGAALIGDLGLKLNNNKGNNYISPSKSSAEVLFIAVCE